MFSGRCSWLGEYRESVIRGKDLTQRQRTFLAKEGCLIEIMKGWYLLAPPGVDAGDTTLWHGNDWAFLAFYLEERFGDDYCVTAETSLDLWAGQTKTPTQAIVMTRSGGNNQLTLNFGSSLLAYRDEARMPPRVTKLRGRVRVCSKSTQAEGKEGIFERTSSA